MKRNLIILTNDCDKESSFVLTYYFKIYCKFITDELGRLLSYVLTAPQFSIFRGNETVALFAKSCYRFNSK